MDQQIYHGNLSPKELAQALMAEFNHGNMHAQAFGNDKNMVVQIATRERQSSGGETAISVTLKQAPDGVSVQIGKQAWLGVAASLGQTLFSAWRNPWNVLHRLDDLAQDIQSIQLMDSVVEVISRTARAANATFELSERLRRIVCDYCGTGNPVGTSSCIACGAPMGKNQPRTCKSCGFVLKTQETRCPNCGSQV